MEICPAKLFMQFILPYSCMRSKLADENSCRKPTPRIDHWMKTPDRYVHMNAGDIEYVRLC